MANDLLGYISGDDSFDPFDSNDDSADQMDTEDESYLERELRNLGNEIARFGRQIGSKDSSTGGILRETDNAGARTGKRYPHKRSGYVTPTSNNTGKSRHPRLDGQRTTGGDGLRQNIGEGTGGIGKTDTQSELQTTGKPNLDHRGTILRDGKQIPIRPGTRAAQRLAARLAGLESPDVITRGIKPTKEPRTRLGGFAEDKLGTRNTARSKAPEFTEAQFIASVKDIRFNTAGDGELRILIPFADREAAKAFVDAYGLELSFSVKRKVYESE